MKASDWNKVRAAWKRANPPSHEGYYLCALCGKPVHMDDVEIDHIQPRSSSPHLVSEHSNLQPTHGTCNSLKGSKRLKPLVAAEDYEFRSKLNL